MTAVYNQSVRCREGQKKSWREKGYNNEEDEWIEWVARWATQVEWQLHRASPILPTRYRIGRNMGNNLYLCVSSGKKEKEK